jgi:hypothetical protein
VEVGRVTWDATGDGCDAAVAGSAEDLCDLGRFEQSPYDGVLAATTTDYQNLHSETFVSLMCFW